MSTRYFEYVGEDAKRGVSNSSKFWEITVDGSVVTVRFGKIGATGQTTVKKLDSSDEAKAHAAKLIHEKTKKGYLQCAPAPAPAGSGTSLDTKAEILANLWMEYRDSGDFDGLLEYDELGFPLAYAITHNIVQATKHTDELVNELFAVLLEIIDKEDTGFNSLEEILDIELKD